MIMGSYQLISYVDWSHLTCTFSHSIRCSYIRIFTCSVCCWFIGYTPNPLANHQKPYKYTATPATPHEVLDGGVGLVLHPRTKDLALFGGQIETRKWLNMQHVQLVSTWVHLPAQSCEDTHVPWANGKGPCRTQQQPNGPPSHLSFKMFHMGVSISAGTSK